MMEEIHDFPAFSRGWVWTTLGETAEVVLGQSPPSSTYNQDGIGLPFYQGKAEFGDTYPAPRKWCTSPKKIAEREDVLISVRAPVGPTNICPEESCIGRGLAAIRGLGGIAPLFILYLLRSLENVIAGQGTGTTFNAIRGKQLRGLVIPLAPLPEQHRIASKIEQLFTQLDAGMASLEKARAQLQRYRQAVLKAAMEGELTKEWRAAHKGELEPGSVLLERISREREQAKGKSRQHFEPDWSELPALPDGWAHLFLEDLSARDSNAIRRGPFGSAVRKAYFVAAGYKVYEQKNVIANDFTLGSYYIDQDKFGELKRFELRGGDVVVSCSGTIGKIAIAPLTIQPGIINQALLKITLDDSIVLPPYFVYLFKSKVHDIIRHSTRGSAMKNIASVRELKRIPFPVAPLPEQHRLVEEMEYRLSIADEMERALNETLVRGERLRQSILKMAFEGKLVPHDPTDEPASVLLERIKAEKAKRETEKKTRKKKPRKDTPQQLELI